MDEKNPSSLKKCLMFLAEQAKPVALGVACTAMTYVGVKLGIEIMGDGVSGIRAFFGAATGLVSATVPLAYAIHTDEKEDGMWGATISYAASFALAVLLLGSPVPDRGHTSSITNGGPGAYVPR